MRKTRHIQIKKMDHEPNGSWSIVHRSSFIVHLLPLTLRVLPDDRFIVIYDQHAQDQDDYDEHDETNERDHPRKDPERGVRGNKRVARAVGGVQLGRVIAKGEIVPLVGPF